MGVRTGGVAGRVLPFRALTEAGVGGLGERVPRLEPASWLPGCEGARGGILDEVGVGLPTLGAPLSA